MRMPNGRARSKAARPGIDARDVEDEIRRNRESNEKFMRDYSAWFEEHRSKKQKGRKAG